MNRVARHKQVRNPVVIGRRKVKPERLRFSGKKFVGKLDQNTGTVTRLGIRPDRAPMFEIAENFQPVFDDLAARLVADRTDHPDSAGIVFVCSIVQTLVGLKARIQRLRRNDGGHVLCSRNGIHFLFLSQCRRPSINRFHPSSIVTRIGPASNPATLSLPEQIGVRKSAFGVRRELSMYSDTQSGPRFQ